MEKRHAHPFRRVLAMLLCVAMLASYVVLPSSAADGDTTVLTTPDASNLKTSVSVNGANYYDSNTGIALTYGSWLSTLYLDDGYSRTLVDFVDEKSEQWLDYISLMPERDALGAGTPYGPVTYNGDGSFNIQDGTSNTYSAALLENLNIQVPVDQEFVYFNVDTTTSNGAWFNTILYFTDNTNASFGDVAAGSHWLDITAHAGKTIKTVQFYVVGDGTTITYNQARLVSASSDAGFTLPGYTAYIIEHMGGDSELFFVDAVIDGDEKSDEMLHQIRPKMQYGFVLYVPDTYWTATNPAPSRGDIVAAGWNKVIEALAYQDQTVDGVYSIWPSTSRSNSAFATAYAVEFYENPADTGVVTPFEKDTTTSVANSVNATVQMFNYDSNINSSSNPLSFWNGFWGYGGDIESEDGSGVEDETYRYPVLSPTLDANGYPQFYTDSSKTETVSLGYLFGQGVTAANGGTTGINGVTVYPEMTNGGGLFRYDPNTGNYFYDSMQNAAWYDTANNKFVLYDSLIVRPWYNSTGGTDYDTVASSNYDKYLDAGYMSNTSTADPESYGNFLPFNQVTNTNITLDGAVYAYTDRTADDRHISTTDYSAIVRASSIAGTLEKYGLIPAAAQKVLAANKSLGAELVDEIGKTYQYSKGLYTARLEEEVDMWFGMSVDFDFYQPYNGQTKTASGQVNDMVFDFEGDDDVFVYIGVWNEEKQEYDYKLVLDIGGVHEARKGLINFATGAVEYVDCNNVTQKKTLQDIFNLEGDTFDDFEKLSLKFFYMERGGNISCCRLSFNIPTLPQDSLTVSKALDTVALGTQTYQFRVLTKDGNDLFIPKGAEYTINGSATTYEVGDGGYFTLQPGQSATFTDIAQYVKNNDYYYVVEESIDSSEVDEQFVVQSPTYSLNGSGQGLTTETATGSYVYRTVPMKLNVSSATASVDDSGIATVAENTSNLVGFTNVVDTAKLGTLRITKQIKDGANISADASFDMRVKLGGYLLPVGTEYTVTDGTITTTETVKIQGIVTLKAGQTAIIDRILSTSKFEVTEISYNTSPSYSYTNNVENTTVNVTCTNSGASGTMPLDGDITIIVTNDDSSGLVVDKTVASVAGKTDEFVLTLEAFATGKTSSFTSTTPADIVLVLDQSASMYAPKGSTSDRYTRWNDPDGIQATPGIGSIEISNLNSTKGSKLGYYVAQTNVSNRNVSEGTNDHNGNGTTGETIPCYDWFIAQYVSGTGWVYVRVGDTTTSVTVDTSNLLVYDSPDSNAQYNKTIVSGQKDSNGEYTPIASFYYYESQYAALYESVNSFVDELSATGVDHRIAITGFSSPYYDGKQYYDGSGLYVDGQYYLYDTDYKYKGVYDKTKGIYLLYAPTDGDVYASMKSILPDEKKGIVWTDTLPTGQTEDDLFLLDVTGAFAGDYFAHKINVIKPLCTQEEYADQTVSGQYGNALVSVKTGYDSLKNSIEAVRTNYQQTCPAVGLEMAQSIFAANTATGRDQIVVLFTDGVPTVGKASDNEDSSTQVLKTKEENWSGLAGARDAIELARVLKQGGTQVYTIGTSGLSANVPNAYGVTPGSTTTISGKNFLMYVSSEYKDASAVHTVAQGDYTDVILSSVLTVTPGDKTEGADYTKTSDDGDISVAFKEIMQSVSQPSVTLGANAVLKEVLSDYFDLNNVDLDNLRNDIKVYLAPYTGTSAIGEYTFGARENAPDNIVVTLSADGGRDNVVVNVTGFDYSTNYVREENGTPEGYKIIVEVPIKDRAGFWGGNGVPTNKDTTAIYDKPVENGGIEVQDFPMPEVNIPVDPEVTANDVTVYYGGAVSENNLGVTIKIDGFDVTIKDDDTFTPAAEWMDDYATLYWDTTEEYPDMNPVNSNNTAKNDKQNEHLYAVKLDPDGGDVEFKNLNPSNTAGETVVIGTSVTANDGVTIIDQKAETKATVYILVPVITFKDSTIEYGTTPDLSQNLVRVEWVNSVAGETYSDNILGSAPALIYTYTSGGTTAGGADYTSDTMIQVTVKTEAGVDLMSVVTFKWQVCNGVQDTAEHAHDPDGENANHSGTADTFEFWIHVAPYAQEDAVVIDFGLDVTINVKDNDRLVNAVIGNLATKNSDETYTDLPEGFTGIYGTATITNGVVTYKLNRSTNTEQGTFSGMEMKSEEVFYYQITYTTENGETQTAYAKVTIIPATTIYFEDDFVKYTVVDGFTMDKNGNTIGGTTTEGGWSTATDGSVAKDTQDEDRPGDGLVPVDDLLDELKKGDRYGYDSSYTGMTMYSNGSAKWVTVDSDTYATATFSFWGTGFDVISLTSADTGAIGVIVSQYGENNELTVVENYLVDTYYGYKFEGGKWVVDTESTDALYQVPVIKVNCKNGYGHYQVKIVATYADFFNHKGDGSYDFYLDAIRIYDPAKDGTGNTVVQGAYTDDGEGWPLYQELRNMIITKNTFDSLEDDDSVEGIVFIDGNAALTSDNASQKNPLSDKTYAISDYANFGPNNELYLAPNQAIAFDLADVSNVASIQIALKTVGDFGTGANGSVNNIPDGSGAASVKIYDASDTSKTNAISTGSIATATDMYYDITDLMGKTVIIENTGSAGILSITNVKITYKQDPYGTSSTGLIGSTSNTGSMALAALNAVEEEEQPEQQPGENAPGTDVEENPTTGDLNVEIVSLMVLTFCMMTLAVLVFSETRKRNAK